MSERHELYRETGVDTAEADTGISRIVTRIKNTWPTSGVGRVRLPVGYFANVIELGVSDVGLAICTDGVGSKTIIADMMGKHDTIGIDCVAMNVNDLLCVGAKPLTFVDYIAIEKTNSDMLDAIGKGLAEGAELAGVSITGGETAQLRDVVTGFDLVGTAVGSVPLDRVIAGQHIEAGDVVIGVRSSGIHSNGLSLARRAFFELTAHRADQYIDELGTTVGEELLRPTDIYAKESLEIISTIGSLKAVINITGDGLLNLSRVLSDTGYMIDNLIDPHPVFNMIQRLAGINDAEMYEVFNMGIGFCYVVGAEEVDSTLAILRRHGRVAQPIGRAFCDFEKRVIVKQRNLLGRHKTFKREEAPARLAV